MNFIEFANPAGWWWAGLAVPILLLYILKIRLRRQRVSTLLFWDRLYDEKKTRAWWQRLRHWLSLLLQLAFLLLVVTALTDPLWSWQKQQQRQVVLVIDNSASMQAVEDGQQTRLDQAKELARAMVRALRSGDRMAILSAAAGPEVAIGMTNHQRSLLAAIDQIPRTDGPTAVAATVAAAEGLLADETQSDREQENEIVVFTDGCFDDVEQLQATANVRLYGIGAAQDNIGITRYQVRRSLIDAVGYQVLVDVTNFSKDTRSCRVELNLDDELVDVVPLEVAPGATETRVVDHTSPSGGKLIATLDVEDALAIDNTAVAVLPACLPIPVVLVTEGNLFLKSVLESIPLVELELVAAAPPAAPARGLLVLDRKVPAALPPGNVIVVDPRGDTDLWTLGEPISQPIVATVQSDSPLTQHVRLENVLFPGARQLQFTGDHQPLIEDPLDQPLMARLRRPGGDVLVLTCSLEQGDLPLRIAFPVLMKNAVEWFMGNSGELRPAVAAGEMVVVDIATAGADDSSTGQPPEKAPAAGADGELALLERAAVRTEQNLVLVSPQQRMIPITTANQQATIGPLLETGIWMIRPVDDSPSAGKTAGETARRKAADDLSKSDSSQTLQVACNLANVSESDLRPRVELPAMDSVQLAALGGHSLWFYLTLVAALLICGEWWLYQRRIVG